MNFNIFICFESIHYNIILRLAAGWALNVHEYIFKYKNTNSLFYILIVYGYFFFKVFGSSGNNCHYEWNGYVFNFMPHLASIETMLFWIAYNVAYMYMYVYMCYLRNCLMRDRPVIDNLSVASLVDKCAFLPLSDISITYLSLSTIPAKGRHIYYNT